jgi:hypothetical protein
MLKDTMNGQKDYGEKCSDKLFHLGQKCSIWNIDCCHNKHLSLPKIGIEFVLKFFNKKMGG